MHLKVHWCNLQVCWNPARSRKNDRYGHSESNALIGIEFDEFRQKLKNLEFRQNSSWSLGAIWIDSVSFEVDYLSSREGGGGGKRDGGSGGITVITRTSNIRMWGKNIL